jgi:hypothetical protein
VVDVRRELSAVIPATAPLHKARQDVGLPRAAEGCSRKNGAVSLHA